MGLAVWRNWTWPRVDWYSVSGVLLLISVLVVLALGGRLLGQTLADAERLPIDEIALVGERSYTRDEEVRLALSHIEGDSLVTADMELVRTALTGLPWVNRVTVRREWPNRLRLYLVEQRPMAHWNGEQWLNQDAQVFRAPKRAGIASLPNLAGPQGSSEKVWQTWLKYSELLKLNGFIPRSLTLSHRHAWTLTLEDGLELRLGRIEGIERLQRFIELWPTLSKQGRRAEYIDIRYDTGLAVGWQLEQRD